MQGDYYNSSTGVARSSHEKAMSSRPLKNHLFPPSSLTLLPDSTVLPAYIPRRDRFMSERTIDPDILKDAAEGRTRQL